MVIVYSFQTYDGTKDYFPAGSVANKIMRISMVIIALVIGLFVTNFNNLFSLVCSASWLQVRRGHQNTFPFLGSRFRV